MNFLEEQARRVALRDEKAREAAAQFAKENKARTKARKLLTRWEPGITVRDKRQRQTYKYLGNVVEEGKTLYLLEAGDDFGYPPIRFSREPHKDIVRLNRGPV
jgi:hypothetical protein